jgi:serine/threonine protein phosphatase PrpC
MDELELEMRVTRYGPARTHWWPLSVPSHPIAPISSPPSLSTTDPIAEESVAAQSISTYPVFDGGARRDGDPIADAFLVRLFENGACFGLADGCGWGPRSFRAAKRAIEGFGERVEAHLSEVDDVRDAARFLLNAMSGAHDNIWEHPKQHWEVGSTTFLGALLLKLEKTNTNAKESSTENPSKKSENGGKRSHKSHEISEGHHDFVGAPYVLVCCNIGDCKAFVIRGGSGTEKPEVVDVTVESKRSVNDKCDPGGRIGPYLEGDPDTRNLLISTMPIYPGDTICLVSDGVHDNLDPETLGFPLSESISRNLAIAQEILKLDIDKDTQTPIIPEAYHNNKAWESITLQQGELLKAEFRESKIADFYQSGSRTPSDLLKKLLDHCVETTSALKEWMEQNPAKAPPSDYVEYPGKMDHTTAIVYRIPTDSTSPVPSEHHLPAPEPHILKSAIEAFKWGDIKQSVSPSSSNSRLSAHSRRSGSNGLNESENVSTHESGINRVNATSSPSNHTDKPEHELPPPRSKKGKGKNRKDSDSAQSSHSTTSAHGSNHGISPKKSHTLDNSASESSIREKAEKRVKHESRPSADASQQPMTPSSSAPKQPSSSTLALQSSTDLAVTKMMPDSSTSSITRNTEELISSESSEVATAL